MFIIVIITWHVTNSYNSIFLTCKRDQKLKWTVCGSACVRVSRGEGGTSWPMKTVWKQEVLGTAAAHAHSGDGRRSAAIQKLLQSA